MQSVKSGRMGWKQINASERQPLNDKSEWINEGHLYNPAYLKIIEMEQTIHIEIIFQFFI